MLAHHRFQRDLGEMRRVVRDGVDAATRTWLDSATAPLSSP
jgi:hypothetical protein